MTEGGEGVEGLGVVRLGFLGIQEAWGMDFGDVGLLGVSGLGWIGFTIWWLEYGAN